MTQYGTIPTSSSPSESSSLHSEYISRAKERFRSGLGDRRPWKQFLAVRSIGLPRSLGESITRARTNFAYFRMNYAIVGLIILFLSLLWHPISLIVFVVMMAAWLFLYFLRDEPLVILHRTIDDRVVLTVLSIFTVAILLFTGATVNILVAIAIVVVVVVLHAAFRKIDDLEEEVAGTETRGLISSV